MGTLALAAKITHVPSMYLSEMEGPHKGCRAAAIAGHKEIRRRCIELGVDTLVVFDTHWLVNSGFHINNAASFSGVYTSNELPHFIKNMPYEYQGNVELGDIIANAASDAGVFTRAHSDTTLALEYGTLVPMRYMNPDNQFKVVSIAAFLTVHDLQDSAKFGAALREAIEQKYDGTVAILASGSLSHRFAQNGVSEQYLHKVWSPFLKQTDDSVVEMWENGEWETFTEMLDEYAVKCHGEGNMHDTAMLLGALGWDKYQGKVEVVTPYFGSSGTGQINAIFPVL
jgi:3,4-dihydroxyphenylacetate 2,3-dioxygenase